MTVTDIETRRVQRRPRFVVAVTRGNITIATGTLRRDQGSAAVCDSWDIYRVVANYRSEDPTKGRQGGFRRGLPGAIAAAENHAAELNGAT